MKEKIKARGRIRFSWFDRIDGKWCLIKEKTVYNALTSTTRNLWASAVGYGNFNWEEPGQPAGPAAVDRMYAAPGDLQSDGNLYVIRRPSNDEFGVDLASGADGTTQLGEIVGYWENTTGNTVNLRSFMLGHSGFATVTDDLILVEFPETFGTYAQFAYHVLPAQDTIELNPHQRLIVNWELLLETEV